MGENRTHNDFSMIVKKIQLAAFANLNILATYWYVLCSKQRCKQTSALFPKANKASNRGNGNKMNNSYRLCSTKHEAI
jgi:hypothetical protein